MTFTLFIRKIDILLDIGCGIGDLTLELNRFAGIQQIYAIDISRDMLDYFKQNNSAPNIRLLLQDINVEWSQLKPELRDLEGKVDLIFSNFVFHWMYENNENLLKNIRRLLTKNGRAYCNMITLPDPIGHMNGMLRYFFTKLPIAIPSSSEQVKHWRQSLRGAGLQVLKLDQIMVHYMLDPDAFDKGNIVSFLLSICSHLF